MMVGRRVSRFVAMMLLLGVCRCGADPAQAQSTGQPPPGTPSAQTRNGASANNTKPKRVTQPQRKAGAAQFQAIYQRAKAKQASIMAAPATGAIAAPNASAANVAAMAMPMPGQVAVPHYFGPYPNYANSPMPQGPVAAITLEDGGTGYSAPVVTIDDLYGTGSGATATATVTGGVITAIQLTSGGSGYGAPLVTITDSTGDGALASAAIGGPFVGGLRKFVDGLPGLTAAAANNLGQYLPVAIPDTTSYPGCDYYEIELGQYTEQLHSDLPPTTLRGYRQTNTTDPTVSKFHYLGPIIIANRDTPVRIKFTNNLPTGAGGDLFLPVDRTVMGAGMGPMEMAGMPGMMEMYTENRATLHLHGGFVPWISDGTPHQWVTPAGENTSYPKGVSVRYVPDMPDPGPGSLTFYYNNQQSARLMFYHDHAYGITRLNVYAGEAAGYLITDKVEQDLVNGTNVTGANPTNAKLLPGLGMPLILQDKTFVDASTIGFQDPNWRWGSMPGMAMTGDLWLPSVYMPAQNPWDLSGANPFGRWQYGPWFWPPTNDIVHGPVPNEYYDPINAPWEPPTRPDMPNPSMGMEAFMDTPMVNGTAYPNLTVDPKPYRFRILNAANDRFWNLHWYLAEPLTVALKSGGSGYTSTPTVSFTGGGATTPASAVAVVSGGVSSIDLSSGGVGYTSIPLVSITGGGGSGATASAAVQAGIVTGVTITSGGAGYTSVPTITFTGGNPTTPATATATVDGLVSGLTLADGGAGYTSTPTVTLTGGGGTGATATADISSSVSGVSVSSGGEGYAYAPAVIFSGGNPTRSAVAVATVSGGVNAVALTSSGDGYTSAPDISFVGGNPVTPATAVATMSGGVTAVNLTSGGAGYTSAPTVSFVGGGAAVSATGVATVQSAVSAITVTSGGSGYSVSPTVTLTGGGATMPATAVAVVDRGVRRITVTSRGRNYTSVPTVAITGGGGTGATAVAAIANGRVTGITVTNPGSGYTSAPRVTISGGGGRNATATANITRYISAINLTSSGTGYTSAPTVTITDSTGTGAAATAAIAGTVTSVTITDPGADYTSVPTIEFTGGGATTQATATAVIGGRVTGVVMTSPGAGYTSAPSVVFTGGGATSPASATASITSAVTGVTIIDPGAGYTSAPTVTFLGGGATAPAAATASIAGVVTGLTLTNQGTGYTSAPTVEFVGGTPTSPASATATIASVVTGVTITDPGVGYTSAPSVDFTGGGATMPATATASIGGSVTSVIVTNSGTGYTSAPTVTFLGGGATTPASATAAITGKVDSIVVTDPGAGYTAAPTVTISGGGGSGAVAIASVNTEVKMVPAVPTPGYPATWPTDGRAGGAPDPNTAGPAWIQIGTEGGFLPAPVVVANQPINWNANQTAFNFGNVTDHSLLLGCAERADVIVDFTPYAGKTLILYNDAPAAFPAIDPRYDYYTGDPDQTDTGGAPPTQPGYGPNTRTVMRVQVSGTPSGTPAPNSYDAAYLDALKTAWAKTDTKRGVFEVGQDPIIVPQAAYNSAYNASFPGDTSVYVKIFDNSLTFTPIGATAPVTLGFQPKAIHDEMGATYDVEYGRMSGTLGLELPNSTNLTQNFLLYGYASPPVDLLQDSMTPLGTLKDGTQIWKITHNGVDTHPIHFHLVNVQLINRVAWDGALLPPEPNELGWKETVRVNPLEDTIVAMRPVAPTQPFDIPNSVRLIDPTMPEGAPLMTPPGGFVDPAANPVTILNHYVNFGWEYVWHCHILSHEEMDMMHSLCFSVAPKAPTNLAVAISGSGAARQATLSWNDNSANETAFIIQRAQDSSFTSNPVTFSVGENVTSYSDPVGGSTTSYYYRVLATNVVGDTAVYSGSADGFPKVTMNSDFTNTVSVAAAPVPAAPTNLRATLQAGPAIALRWRDNATNETGFVVERSDNGGPFVQIAAPGPRNNTGNVNYVDSSLVAGTTYDYRVAAQNANGLSAYSNTATVTTPQALAAPTNLRLAQLAGTGNRQFAVLSWTDNANNEQGFYLERSANNGATWTRVGQTAANTTSFRNSNLASRTTYLYRVQAFNATGVSAFSNTLTVTTR